MCVMWSHTNALILLCWHFALSGWRYRFAFFSVRSIHILYICKYICWVCMRNIQPKGYYIVTVIVSPDIKREAPELTTQHKSIALVFSILVRVHSLSIGIYCHPFDTWFYSFFVFFVALSLFRSHLPDLRWIGKAINLLYTICDMHVCVRLLVHRIFRL